MQADMTSAAKGASTRALRQTAAVMLERFPAADAAVDMIVMGFLRRADSEPDKRLTLPHACKYPTAPPLLFRFGKYLCRWLGPVHWSVIDRGIFMSWLIAFACVVVI